MLNENKYTVTQQIGLLVSGSFPTLSAKEM